MSNIATIPAAPRPLSFEHQMQLAQSFAKSGLFGIKTADQALALMALCEAEGLHPAIAVRDFHIIQGKPALKADAMLARFQNAGGRVKWLELTDERVCAEFTHIAGGTATIDWDKARAQTAGFWGKDNWKKFPRAMLRARVVSEGIRTVFPGVVTGLYTPEEVQDFEPAKVEATVEKPPFTGSPTDGVWDGLSPERVAHIEAAAVTAHEYLDQDDLQGAVDYRMRAGLDGADETTAFWTLFKSYERAAMKLAHEGKVEDGVAHLIRNRAKQANKEQA